MSTVDGVHFGTGEDAESDIFALLNRTSDAPTIVNEPEAQWHYAAITAQRPGSMTVWRSSPNRKPAQSNWNAHAYSREIFTGIDDHYARTSVYPSDVLLLNELNLDYERGDAKDDGGAWDTDPANWPGLYIRLAIFLEELLPACVERAADRGMHASWWFPGWAPGHGEMDPDIASLWVPTARLYDGICLHAYTDVQTITQTVEWYAGQFPHHELLLGEWNTINLGTPNSPERFEMEVEIRQRLRALGRVYPALSACYFIYAWAEDRTHEHDIANNGPRLQIWDGTIPIEDDGYGPIEPPVEPEEPETPEEPEPSEPPNGEMMPGPVELPLGVDVSVYQGYPDWDAAKADGVQFAFTKATEGVAYTNETFVYNWGNLKSAGLYRGAYHFARPDFNTPEEEAEYFWLMVHNAGIEQGDLLALDLEDYNGSLVRASQRVSVARWALAFLRHLESLCGFKPLIYVARNVIDEYGLAEYPELGEYGLWLASWRLNIPSAPAPWDVLAFWQFSDSGEVNGIEGSVDVDRFNGPADRIPLYGYGALPAPETPPEPENPPTPDSPADTTSDALQLCETRLGYATHDVADAIEKELRSIEASLGALWNALNSLRASGG